VARCQDVDDPSAREVQAAMKKDDRSLHGDYERARKPDPDPSQPNQDRKAAQRNAGIAIAVLALVVIVVFVALIMGGTDTFR
jgi:hypothetical protein